MKRLILTASLAIAAIMVAPVASASALEATGVCEIKGTATFGAPLKLTVPTKTTYSFESAAVEGGKCESIPATKFEKAKVSGNGELSCKEGKEEGAGTGTIEFEIVGLAKEKHEFEFKFSAVGPFVVFETVTKPGIGAKGGGKANGVASFANDTAGLEKCAAGTAGSLKFTAVAVGTI
jgi:hypothetical protein